MSRDAYQSDKQHLRRQSSFTPRWLMYIFRRTYPEIVACRRHTYSASAYSGWNFLMHEIYFNFHGSELFDHHGTDLEGQLVTEPYGDVETIRRHAVEFAAKHGLAFSVEPVPFHGENVTRVVFWPLPEWNLDLRSGCRTKAVGDASDANSHLPQTSHSIESIR